MFKIKIECDGITQEFNVLGSRYKRERGEATHYLNGSGDVTPIKCLSNETSRWQMLQQITPHVTFDGVTFKITGGQEIPKNSWALRDINNKRPPHPVFYAGDGWTTPRYTLLPVTVEQGESCQ